MFHKGSPVSAGESFFGFIKPRSVKRLVPVMPRRGLSAVDGVEGLPWVGKQRPQVFTFGYAMEVDRLVGLFSKTSFGLFFHNVSLVVPSE